jgi:hypothetical protein
MKKLATKIAAAVAVASITLSGTAFARHFTVINNANYKMRIVAHFRNSHARQIWYCPSHQRCRLNHFPRGVRNVEVHKYSNPNKYGYYPNKNTDVARPFNNKAIHCENRRHRIACFNVHAD